MNRLLQRVLDLIVASVVIVLMGLPTIFAALAIRLEDGSPVLFRSQRVGKGGELFTVFKLRTMRQHAATTGVDTTTAHDPRLLRCAPLIRRTKLDEVPQMLNISNGTMSVVGPRPNVEREVAKYTEDEQRLLSVRPGLTDLASVALSDLGELVAGQPDANEAYETLIRPTKSVLSLHHIDNRGWRLDMSVIVLTAVAVIDPRRARRALRKVLESSPNPSVVTHIDRISALRPLTEDG